MTLQYIVYVIFYEIAFIIVCSPVIILMSFVTNIDIQRGSYLAYLIGVPFLFIGVIYLFFLPYLAHQVAKRKVFENSDFHDALLDSLSEVRIKLSLFPFIGRFFEYKKKD